VAKSLVTVFVDAFKKAAGKKPAKPDVDIKTYGPLGSTFDGGSFDPLRPAPGSDTGQGIDPGGVSVGGERDMAGDAGLTSSDPEEGGEGRSV
jgi:hypothetical protein